MIKKNKNRERGSQSSQMQELLYELEWNTKNKKEHENEGELYQMRKDEWIYR